MSTRDGAITRAHAEFDDGTYLEDLARRVAIPTESQVPEMAGELHRYQTANGTRLTHSKPCTTWRSV